MARLQTPAPPPRPRPRPGGGAAQPAALSHVAVLREVLKRFPRLRLLLGGEVDAVAREERAGLRGDLERLVRRAPGRQLEHSGAVGVEPQLGDEPPPELLRRETQLEDEDG